METIERALKMYRAAAPKPPIKRLADDLGVHPRALRGWIRQDEEDRRKQEELTPLRPHIRSHGALALTAAHACLTVLRAAELEAGKAETDPPASSP